ncbi:hypothetical protein F443_17448 [Phytophthora nicotianae P1569]|uniref:Uncharacterized protein n=1 Tax=Phytophthora nicotianae P1569 TaxID=1317065 RepID=V9EBG0_PHYNI|nr:hypothetical protein F443_17448 [Phytophthora nicotianae P1569]
MGTHMVAEETDSIKCYRKYADATANRYGDRLDCSNRSYVINLDAVTAIAEVTTMENVLRVVDTSASSAAVSMLTLRSANTANDRLDYSN